MNEPSAERFRHRLVRWLEHPKLPFGLALVALLLTAPSLAVGFHLDDYVHAYLLSDLPGSDDLLRAYESPFGIANGESEINRWQMEKGYAPWWTSPELLISLWRPVAELPHRLDHWLWPASAWAMHAHSLLYFALLAMAAAFLFRGVLGAGTVGGMAALLYAVDHTHGFAVGWIANRNALLAALFGVLALLAHHRWRLRGSGLAALLAPLLFLCGLLSGEAAVAVLGYLLSHALFIEKGPPLRRLAALVPCGAVALGWRVAYNWLGYGARDSGLYIDPVREPLRFAVAALERLPVLVMGQYALPPAEAYMFAPGPVATAIWLFALLLLAGLAVVLLPLLLRQRQARFWAFGMACSLLTACSTHPNNRLLFFSGLGAMALLSLVWHGLMERADWLRPGRAWRLLSRGLVAAIMGLHLLVSPLLLPLAACSILLTSPVKRAVAEAIELAGLSESGSRNGRDLVIVSSPDEYFVKLLPVVQALERRPAPRRLRALCFGPVPLEVTRTDARTLSVRFVGGILPDSILQLYRDARLPMRPGQLIELEGLQIRIEQVTGDGRAERVRFIFDQDLDTDRFRWLAWENHRYVPFPLPPIGQSVRVAPARVPFGL